MSPERKIEIVKTYLTEIHYNDNTDIVDEVFHKDFIGHPPPPSPEINGRDELKKGMMAAMKALSDKVVTFHHLLVDGDFITVHWSLTGIHSGEFMGVKPSGKPIELNTFMIERFQDGKIIEAWARTNQLAFMTQIGLLQP